MNHRIRTIAAGLGCFGLLAGCAPFHQPSSIADGQIFPHRSLEASQTPVVVTAIDGAPRAPGPITLTPGRHVLDYAPLVDGSLGPGRATVFHVIPCTKYQLTTRPGSGSQTDWTLVVQGTEATGDCAGNNPYNPGVSAPSPTDLSYKL